MNFTKTKADLTVNNPSRQAVVHAANAILYLWNELIQEAEAQERDPLRREWYRHAERQAYRNAVIAMQTAGLIESYDVVNIQCLVDGAWSSDRHTLEFVPAERARAC
jgi:hypothetical protein